MDSILVLENPIQKYAWGSHTFIAELMGRPVPSPQPEAELWMGAHPKAPSMVVSDGGMESLLDLIERLPQKVLGNKVAKTHAGRLPYLFKILAAERPLSIQAHPNKAQAREGYQRENGLNIGVDAAERNYRDDNHKPECICALTPFWGMNGFRRVSEISAWVKKVSPVALGKEVMTLENQPDSQGLKCFMETLLSMNSRAVGRVLSEAVGNARRLRSKDPVYEWIVRLAMEYPGDMGALFPAILNLVCLAPGQAMYLPAGQFHAYLDGSGIELMANSDNVLRGGLTPKHIDISELMKVVVFDEQPLELLVPEQRRECEAVYATPAREFELSVIDVDKGRFYTAPEERSADIILITTGEATIEDPALTTSINLTRGMSVIVPACVAAYRIIGNAKLFKAGVPL